MKDVYVFPQDHPDGRAGLARGGGLKTRDLAMIVFTAAYILQGLTIEASITRASVAVEALFNVQ